MNRARRQTFDDTAKGRSFDLGERLFVAGDERRRKVFLSISLSIESVTSSRAGCSRRSRWGMTRPRAHHKRAVACFPQLVIFSVPSHLLPVESL